jgi:DNA adenine methylase
MPILKWAGGKGQILDKLYYHFPKKYKDYHEPMIGGGALFFDLKPQGGTVNDINPRLINFYKSVRDYPEKLIKVSKSFKSPTSPPDPNLDFSKVNRKGKEIKNYYYQQRELFNRRPNGEDFDPLHEAALLLYLNRTCYNGLYRENSSGEFNVPIGRYKNPNWVRERKVLEASEVLQNIKIYNKSFDYILDVAKPRDLVYFDPPYVPMSSTASFTDYSANGFDRKDQKKLLRIAKKLDRGEIKVIISNSGVMYGFYEREGFFVNFISATRAINSDPENRGEVAEIIATNIPKKERIRQAQKTLDKFLE